MNIELFKTLSKADKYRIKVKDIPFVGYCLENGLVIYHNGEEAEIHVENDEMHIYIGTIGFIGYITKPGFVDESDIEKCTFVDGSDPNADYKYRIHYEEVEVSYSSQHEYPNIKGQDLYSDDEGTNYIGTITDVAIYENKVLYIHLENPSDEIPENDCANPGSFISCWSTVFEEEITRQNAPRRVAGLPPFGNEEQGEPVTEEEPVEEPVEPTTEEPVIEESVIEEPVEQVPEPVVKEEPTEPVEPTTEEPVTEEPVEPTTEEPVIEESVIEEPVEQVVKEEPTEPVEPTTEEPVTEEPVEPVVEEQVENTEEN